MAVEINQLIITMEVASSDGQEPLKDKDDSQKSNPSMKSLEQIVKKINVILIINFLTK